jgi:A/G-specific adenine glycosylase
VVQPVGEFATRVVEWQLVHGRNNLPWQNTQDPYRVWLSEIMLQQTQVLTVREYFVRFVARFPNVASLAAATLDEVLGLWSGLGYYSRARNLHQCAQNVMALHEGAFPKTAELLVTLPGIGRSTAAAIASLCFNERVAILDANVKRVLTRVLGYGADLSLAANERGLWSAATDMLPQTPLRAHNMPRYTQGVMDLGATVCLPKKPQCSSCPVQTLCVASAAGDPQRYPVRTRKLKRSAESIWLLWAQTRQGAVWLTQRPTPGVWAGLYCLPLFASEEAMLAAVPEPWREHLRVDAVFTHVLTHKDLHMHPWQLSLPDESLVWDEGRWVGAQEWPALGLPAPVRKLLLRA